MRPCRARFIETAPPCVVYKPAGIPARELAWYELALDEYEALRLCDALGLDQAVAAQCMGISRPTLGRILERGRRKVASVLVEGRALLIQGGPVELRCGRGRHGYGHYRAANPAGIQQVAEQEKSNGDDIGTTDTPNR